jgi:hypothetical protein
MTMRPDLCSPLPFGRRFTGDAIGVRDPRWPAFDLSGGVGTAYTSLWAVREALEHHIFGFVAAISQPKPAEFNPHLRVLFVNATRLAGHCIPVRPAIETARSKNSYTAKCLFCK